jgi:hypothetical protein
MQQTSERSARGKLFELAAMIQDLRELMNQETSTRSPKKNLSDCCARELYRCHFPRRFEVTYVNTCLVLIPRRNVFTVIKFCLEQFFGHVKIRYAARTYMTLYHSNTEVACSICAQGMKVASRASVLYCPVNLDHHTSQKHCEVS